ncbi:flagellin N-terminal helical domain-containing protein [Burkholderia thailandensis]|uniref:Flagellin n=2 Tax=Burkholderia thailandensis TaxID=57975 RepID=A0AAW9CWM6_BURTH|nr:flagellin [Burkholderia thailandensis]ABC35429.1 flagellin D [Burkholderia thailandensis E264]AHI67378.1 bacterial flagellin C-terminal helical region family protein [Burkholderia thailandensis H0587]AHI75257.1 bacterial flagellin C-terminal helical region family protein [Burkholderia thailandensis 2002721723]AHI80614.1 bacterial flagellin C-terminal helical region family protein [Burkholderia thailandensis E444]AIC90179.1 bacterial flagellin helical region family protein [Burkholderia thai
MLSLHTNLASMRIQGALGRTQQDLTTSMTRLGTGYRINSASDDAAGLQIATRLKSQHLGMGVAFQNTQNATSMLQTAEGAFKEVEQILHRMNALATQAADSAWTQADRDSLQKEYDALGTELKNIVDNTSYGGEKLFVAGASGATGGKLTEKLTFQIGNTSGEVMELDVSTALAAAVKAFGDASQVFGGGASGASGNTDITSISGANALLDNLSAALSAVGSLRAEIGAGQNRLTHIANNLTNMRDNTQDAEGRIRDVDYASETANMTKLNILQQAGGSMLKQASQMSQLVLSLLQ